MDLPRPGLVLQRRVPVRHLIRLSGIAVMTSVLLSGCTGKGTPDGPQTQPQSTADATIVPADASDAPPLAVRIMAANTTSGGQQSYPLPGPGSRIFQALEPDVVLIQEFQVDGSLDAWVDEVFGPDFEHCIEEVNGLPNGIVSRFPILQCGEWDDPFMINRDFAFARLDLPGERDLWAVSVHFKASSGSSNRKRRADEGRELVDRIAAEIPDHDFLTVGGDFNTQNTNEQVLEILQEVVRVEPPFPDDGRGDGDTNSSRRKPYDWVLVDDDLDPFEVPVRINGLQFDHGLVFDSRIYSEQQLEDHFPPVRSGDSGAPQMQHMAVVRDFHLTGLGSTDGDDTDPPEPPGDGDDPEPPGDGDDPEPPGNPQALDLSGWVIEQQGKALRLTLPSGTTLAPGSTLVIGRAADRQAFETCWSTLPGGVTYLTGSDIGDDSNGFPQINGGESYRLLDTDGQVVDPADGSRLPAAPFKKHNVWKRLHTATGSSEMLANSGPNVDPGTFGGTRGGVGHPVLTEVSDAPDFRCEFLELFYDP